MSRFGQRQSFLVSAIAHVILLVALASVPLRPRPVPASEPESGIEPRRVVRLRLPDLGEGRVRPQVSAPMPSPRPQTRDRISIGAPSTVRAKGPLLLRRKTTSRPPPTGGRTVPQRWPYPRRETRRPGIPRLLQPARGWRPRRPGRVPAKPARAAPNAHRLPPRCGGSSDGSRRPRRWVCPPAPAGRRAPSTSTRKGPTSRHWINHFKGEVYRNWIVPQPALLGLQGQVDIAFTVERDGATAGSARRRSARRS